MDWLKSWNDALDYLEKHLDGEINTAELGRLTGCSPYHFQRMFSYLAGVPLSEYIRRRRMTLAAADLRAGEKVLDVALRYGYDSPTAFNRAFQSVHGTAPSLAKQDGVKLIAFPRIHSYGSGGEFSVRAPVLGGDWAQAGGIDPADGPELSRCAWRMHHGRGELLLHCRGL